MRRTDPAGNWHLYIVRCDDDTLYTGITTDVARRFAEHQSNRGAKRLRGRGPLQLEMSVPAGGRSEALRLEHRVKQLKRSQKLALIGGELTLDDLI